MTALLIEIPGEPTPWEREGQHGRFKFTPKKEAVAMDMIRLEAERDMEGREWPASCSKKGRSIPGAEWKMSRSDGDNLLKLCGDALSGIVWTDDSIIASAEIEKRIQRQANDRSER